MLRCAVYSLEDWAIKYLNKNKYFRKNEYIVWKIEQLNTWTKINIFVENERNINKVYFIADTFIPYTWLQIRSGDFIFWKRSRSDHEDTSWVRVKGDEYCESSDNIRSTMVRAAASVGCP